MVTMVPTVRNYMKVSSSWPHTNLLSVEAEQLIEQQIVAISNIA